MSTYTYQKARSNFLDQIDKTKKTPFFSILHFLLQNTFRRSVLKHLQKKKNTHN